MPRLRPCGSSAWRLTTKRMRLLLRCWHNCWSVPAMACFHCRWSSQLEEILQNLPPEPQDVICISALPPFAFAQAGRSVPAHSIALTRGQDSGGGLGILRRSQQGAAALRKRESRCAGGLAGAGRRPDQRLAESIGGSSELSGFLPRGHPERSRFSAVKDLPYRYVAGRSLTRLNCAGSRDDAFKGVFPIAVMHLAVPRRDLHIIRLRIVFELRPFSCPSELHFTSELFPFATA